MIVLMDEKLNSVAARLRHARKKRGKTQEDMALAIGKSQSSYAHYERGRNEPMRSTSMKICEYLKINFDWLLTGRGDMETSKDRQIYNLLDSVEKEYDADPLIKGMLESLRLAVKSRESSSE